MALRALLDDRMNRGGVGRYGRDLVAGLWEIEGVEAVGVRGRSRRAAAPFTPWGLHHVAHIAARESCDLVHGLHLELPARLRIPTVVTVHDIIPLEHPASMPSGFRRRIFARALERSLARAERVIVPSDATRSSLVRIGAKADKVLVVPNGVSDHFRPLTEHETRQARNRFAGGVRYVASMSHPKPHKNSRILTEVGPMLRGDPGLPLVCVGERMNAPDVVDAGTLHDDVLRLFYGGADAFVLPSLSEGFGLPALEALACGTPVVCGRDVGAFDYLQTAVIEADPLSPAGLASAAALIVTDAALRKRLGDEGLTLARRFSRSRMAAETVNVYRAALGSKA